MQSLIWLLRGFLNKKGERRELQRPLIAPSLMRYLLDTRPADVKDLFTERKVMEVCA